MTAFEAVEPPHRLAEIHFGDTLPIVALRELGDANRWVELIWLNKLKAPYVTDDPAKVVPGVLQSGSLIKIPAQAGVRTNGRNDGRAYERDVRMTNKRMTVTAGGDLDVSSGVDNLKQQLQHRVVTPRGQMIRHPDYGCMIWHLIGKANGPLRTFLGAEYVKTALVADYRVAEVNYSRAEGAMETLRITASVTAVDGGAIDIQPAPGAE